MRDARVFYNKEDQWITPDEIYRSRKQPMTPNTKKNHPNATFITRFIYHPVICVYYIIVSSGEGFLSQKDICH